MAVHQSWVKKNDEVTEANTTLHAQLLRMRSFTAQRHGVGPLAGCFC